MTVLEVHDRKPYKIMDRRREMKKGVMAESLEELIERGLVFIFFIKDIDEKYFRANQGLLKGEVSLYH